MHAALAVATPQGTWPLLSWYAAVRRREPLLAAAAALALATIVPCLIALPLDARTVNDINVWIKPTKFLLSFVVYYATLAWAQGFLAPTAQRSRAGRFVVAAALFAGLGEMVWLLLTAAHGVPAHYNTAPLWRAAYGVAGIGAVFLVTAILVQGLLIARERHVVIDPVVRTALVAGAVIAFGATLVTAGFLSSRPGHWVGGSATDLGGLPLAGWSRSGGDLRVAHFFALHAQQALPLIGLLLAALGLRNARGAMLVVALAYLGLIAFMFVQAFGGRPFIA
jgi:hypothetical protein